MTAASHFWHIWASSLIVTEITFNLDSPATVLQDHAQKKNLTETPAHKSLLTLNEKN
jgi:hypothetical protein